MYKEDPQAFQRFIHWALQTRYRNVRVHMEAQEEECMFFTLSGELVHPKNNRRRFATFTDWFNDVYKTSHDHSFPGLFQMIYVKDQSLEEFLSTIPKEEAEGFQDVAYKSNILFRRILHQLRKDPKPFYTVEWNSHLYSVHQNTTTTEEGDVPAFLRAMSHAEEICVLQTETEKEKKDDTDTLKKQMEHMQNEIDQLRAYASQQTKQTNYIFTILAQIRQILQPISV